MEQENLIDVVRKILPSDKYSDIQPFRGETGSMRQTFTALQGKNGSTRRVFVKVDKTPDTPNGELLRERGCTTTNEISALLSLGVDEALANSISPLIDYYGENGTSVSVEPEFTNSKSLRRTVEEDGVFSREELAVFSQVIPGVRYLIKDKGLFHRDLTPSNILVRRKGNIEARITDLANSSGTADIKESVMPTAGARFVRDPLLGDAFTGQASRYTEQAEIYALGINMLYALTGKIPFSYDFLEREGTNNETGESILSEGLIDKNKHNKTLEKGLKLIPRKSRRYSQLIKRCLTLDEEERYASIDELVGDFDEATKKDSRLKSRIKRFLLGGLFAASLAATGILYFQEKPEEVKPEQKYPVKAEASGSTLEIENNLVDLNLEFYKKNPYRKLDTSRGFLSLNQGDSIWVALKAKEKPWPNSSHSIIPSFEGKIYIEGFEPTRFSISPDMYDDSQSDGMGGGWPIDIGIKAPNRAGNYVLSTEVYAHDEEDKKGQKTALSDIIYLNPGKSIARKRVPMVIGNMEDHIGLRSLVLNGYYNRIFIQTFDEKPIKNDFTYEVSIPEEGIEYLIMNNDSARRWGHINSGIPFPTDPFIIGRIEEATLQLVLRDKKGKVMGYYAMPVQREHFTEHVSWWDLALPGPEFSDKLVEYRKSLERNN